MFYFQNRYFWGFLKRGILGGFFEKKIREKIFPISTFFLGNRIFFFKNFFPKKFPPSILKICNFHTITVSFFKNHKNAIFQKFVFFPIFKITRKCRWILNGYKKEQKRATFFCHQVTTPYIITKHVC